MSDPVTRMRALVAALCSPSTAGRETGTGFGRAAREVIRQAMQEIGLSPVEQEIPRSGGANLIARIGNGERSILLGAHYDHLGQQGGDTYWGADDNAAAVAILVETARALVASPPQERTVWIVAFDAEEPPHFLTDGMGSEAFASEPPVPIDSIDLMVAMDLCGHALGDERAPPEVRESLFVFGAERSAGTSAMIDALPATDGVRPRRASINVLPPLSDYHAFQARRVPFLFVTGGRWRHYHTPTDTPDRLAYEKMAATARWLEMVARAAAARSDERVQFVDGARDDASTVRALREVVTAMGSSWRHGREVLKKLEKLAAIADRPLPMSAFGELAMILGMVESALA